MDIPSQVLYIYTVQQLGISKLPYLVRLVPDGQPASVRIAAEIAFAQELERILGGVGEVARACGAARRTDWDQAYAIAAGVIAQRFRLDNAHFAIESSNDNATHAS